MKGRRMMLACPERRMKDVEQVEDATPKPHPSLSPPPAAAATPSSHLADDHNGRENFPSPQPARKLAEDPVWTPQNPLSASPTRLDDPLASSAFVLRAAASPDFGPSF